MDQEGNLLSVGDIPLPSDINPSKSEDNKSLAGRNLSDNDDVKKANEKEKMPSSIDNSKPSMASNICKTIIDNKKQLNKPLSALEMLQKTYDEELGSSEEEDLLRSESDDESNERKVSKKNIDKDPLNTSILETSATELNSENVVTSSEPDGKRKIENAKEVDVPKTDIAVDVKNYKESLERENKALKIISISESDKSDLPDIEKCSPNRSDIEEHILKSESISATEVTTSAKELLPQKNIVQTDFSRKADCEESVVKRTEESKLGCEISSVDIKSLNENVSSEINLISVNSTLRKDCSNSQLVLSPSGLEKKYPCSESGSKPTDVLITSTSVSESHKTIRLEDIPIPSEPIKASHSSLKEIDKSLDPKLAVPESGKLLNTELPPKPEDDKKICDPAKVISLMTESVSKTEEKKIIAEKPEKQAFTLGSSNQHSDEHVKDLVERNTVGQTETSQGYLSIQENKKDIDVSSELSSSFTSESKIKSKSNISKVAVSSDFIIKTESQAESKKHDDKLNSNCEQVISSQKSLFEAPLSLSSLEQHEKLADDTVSQQMKESVEVKKPVDEITKPIVELRKPDLTKLSDDIVETNVISRNDTSSESKDTLKKANAIKSTDSSLELPKREFSAESSEKFEKVVENTPVTSGSQEEVHPSDSEGKNIDSSRDKVPFASQNVYCKDRVSVDLKTIPALEKSASKSVVLLDNEPEVKVDDQCSKLSREMPSDSKGNEKIVKDVLCRTSVVELTDLKDNEMKSTLISKSCKLEQDKVGNKEVAQFTGSSALKNFEVKSENAAQVSNISSEKSHKNVHECSTSSDLVSNSSSVALYSDSAVPSEKEHLKEKINDNNKTSETSSIKTSVTACEQKSETLQVLSKPVEGNEKMSAAVAGKALVATEEIGCTTDAGKSNLLSTEDTSENYESASESMTSTENKDTKMPIKNQDGVVKFMSHKPVVEDVGSVSVQLSKETDLQTVSKNACVTLIDTTVSSTETDKTECVRTPKVVNRDVMVSEKLDTSEKSLEERKPSVPVSVTKSSNTKISEASSTSALLDKTSKNSTKIGNPLSICKPESIVDTNFQQLQSENVSSENESCDSSSLAKGKESPEPTRRVKLVRPVFTPKPSPDLIKQKPTETEPSCLKQRIVSISTIAKQKSELKGTDEPDFCKLSALDKTECVKVSRKDDLEKQPCEPIKLTRAIKKQSESSDIEVPKKLQQKSTDKQESGNADEKSTTVLTFEKLDKEINKSAANLIQEPVCTEPSGSLKQVAIARAVSLPLEQSSQAKVTDNSEKLLNKDEHKPASEIFKSVSETASAKPHLKLDAPSAKEQQDSVLVKGDCDNLTVKMPDSPKRVRLVRPVTRKPTEKAVVSQSSVAVFQPSVSTSDSKMLRERLEEKQDLDSKPVKHKSVDSKEMSVVRQASGTADDKNESSQLQQLKTAVINVTEMHHKLSGNNEMPVPIDPKGGKVSVNEVQKKEEVCKKSAEVEMQVFDVTKKKEIDSQIKQLEYTLKIGKASTVMIPKEEKLVPKIVEDAPEKSSLAEKEKPKKVQDILEDPDVTITPIVPTDSCEPNKVATGDTNNVAKTIVKSEDDEDEDADESWKHLDENTITPVGNKVRQKSDDLIESRKKVTKVEDQDSAILTTSSGVKINLQKTPPKVLNALISEAQASSSSDDVQFVKEIPAGPDEPTTDPLVIPHIKREVVPVSTDPPKRRRGRPRKIPLEPRQLMEHMEMASGQHGEGEYTSGLFPVPLFDMSETMFTTPSGHHTLFPEQVVPNNTNRPQRSCRGRVKLPSVRTRKPRGSSIAGRVSCSGRGRGRGYKRKFTEDENIITIDNVEQEMMRNQMAGRRRLSAGSKMDDDEGEEELNVDAIKREPESEDDKNLTKAERVLRKKEEKRLRMLEKKRLKQEAREKEKAAAIEAALAEEETRMSAPEGSNKDGHEGLYSSFSERGEKRKSDSGITDGEVGETPTPTKRRKEQYRCCICLEETPLRKLTSPLDHRSWTVLYEAAIVRQFEPILKLTDDITSEIPRTVLYHRNCRSEFTHKKTLAKLTETTVGELNDQLNAEQAIPSNSKEFTVDQIAEYQWPLQGGDLFMIQEQISTYLGVKSFKRKYPDIKRRAVEMEERQWLCDNGLVSESLCDLGLTAVSSAEVLDVMFADFPEKYEEFRKHIREKQARELSSKQKAALCSLLDKKKLEQSKLQTDSKQEAIQSAASWNSNLNKTRGEQRRCSLDLQSLIIHYPKTKGLRMIPPNQLPRRVGHYPVALIPGQFCDFYKSYTPDELRYYPLDTVLYGPMKPNERLCGGGGGSDGSQTDSDDSSSSDDSSDTSSEGTQDTEGTCEEEEKDREKEKQMEEAHCKACGGDKTRNKQDQPEVMIHCAQCTKSCHPTCIGLTVVMVPHIRRYDWQCTDCKTCIQCKDPADEDKMLFCDLCDRGYHIYCVGLRKVPIGRWHCQVCSVCNSCGTTDPGGPDWQHEYKKGEKNSRIYIQTLCGACSKLWRKGRYCQICLRCYNVKPEEDSDLVQCTACDRWMHAECCRTTGSTILGNSGILCEACQERAMPKAVQRAIRP